MTSTFTDREQMKELFKQAILEVFQEERDTFYELFAEIIEDIAMANAIKEGEDSEVVSRQEIFEILEEKV